MAVTVKRYPNNPVLGPDRTQPWEAQAVFNGCPIRDENGYHFLYRALASPTLDAASGEILSQSSIGYAWSKDGYHFGDERRQLIAPQEPWERYGCEDPRVTKIDDTYYITYTAVAHYPHTPDGVTIAIATTKDFRTIERRHRVTTFNAKAMVIFPERVDGKIVALLTMNVDQPPVRIMIAMFDTPEQMWDPHYWQMWQQNLDAHTLHFQRSLIDHIEVGAPPVKTADGWLLFYSYIRNYRGGEPVFGIETVLLDLENPLRVTGRTVLPLLVPEEVYERHGVVPRITFPSGATLEDDEVRLYYGAADTVCAVATMSLKELVAHIKLKDCEEFAGYGVVPVVCERFEGNPIIEPARDAGWASRYTLNPTAIVDEDKVHIIYRAQDDSFTSRMGYAVSDDGLHLSYVSPTPVYVPRAAEEIREDEGFSGCEDARISRLEDRFYMCYTAYNGHGPARVALTSIAVEDFRARAWDKWALPLIISPDGMDDKNACLLPEKVNGRYVFLHRLKHTIWMDYVDDLTFADGRTLGGQSIMCARPETWDSEKVGIAGVPMKVGKEWLMIYHALSRHDGQYRLGAALVDMAHAKVTSRLDYPILEPRADYENSGLRPGTVFSCGHVLWHDDMIYIYYGGADEVVGVAMISYSCLLGALQEQKTRM